MQTSSSLCAVWCQCSQMYCSSEHGHLIPVLLLSIQVHYNILGFFQEQMACQAEMDVPDFRGYPVSLDHQVWNFPYQFDLHWFIRLALINLTLKFKSLNTWQISSSSLSLQQMLNKSLSGCGLVLMLQHLSYPSSQRQRLINMKMYWYPFASCTGQ